MKLVADLHIHSYYSRATSKNLNLEHLTKWAQLKGVDIVGTGDISHPSWLKEMKEKLEPAEEGLFRLKDEVLAPIQAEVPAACQAPVRFMLAGEISSIYKKNDKTRKVHNVIFAPTFDAVERIQAELEKIGNIRSDGRPILGLPSRDLLEIVLEVDPQCYLIPAHIWTPWFSLLGSKSGYDTVEECFEDLTDHIFAVETGLSSDPPMNWRVSMLDRYTLVSNSDAHSPPKLAREATLFDTDCSYPAIFDALKTGDPEAFRGTLEFFPQEGKYHLDGHRKCNICWHPQTTLAHGGLCAVCGKPVTVGVYHRVETLADRPEGVRPARARPFHSLIPLPEILSEIHGVGPKSKRVGKAYDLLLAKLGSELEILLHLPLEQIAKEAGEQLAQGIDRMRKSKIVAQSGYDGEYGIIKVFEQAEEEEAPQLTLFAPEDEPIARETADQPERITREEQSDAIRPYKKSVAPQTRQDQPASNPVEPSVQSAPESVVNAVNDQQQQAIHCTDVPLIITAGPGTGKTRTLTYRIAHLLDNVGVVPQSILAITFTNKAATEMRQRVAALVDKSVAEQLTIKTFHAFGVQILREHGASLGIDANFNILTEEDRQALLKRCSPDASVRELNEYLDQISTAKNQLQTPESSELIEENPALIPIYLAYESALKKNGALDFDDLILRPIQLLESDPACLQKLHARYRWISVDEYQDINLAQYRLLRLLTQDGANLCVIGDPDQAIYGFRGADRSYFFAFDADFPDAKELHLNQNYRSTQTILSAAQQVIGKDQQRATETDTANIWSEFASKIKLTVHNPPTDKAEAEYVVHQIEQMVGGTSYFSIDSGRVDDDGLPSTYTFGDFAILYRMGAQANPLIEALERSGMPYQVVGQTPFFARKDMRELLAFLWFVHNPNSQLHLERILNAGATFEPQTVDQLLALSAESGATGHLGVQRRPLHTLWTLLQQKSMWGGFTPNQRKWLAEIVPFLDTLQQEASDGSISHLIQLVDSFLQNRARQNDAGREERVEQLVRRSLRYEKRLVSFLESTALEKEADAYDPRADRVTVMTLHASKGLEFPVVFVVGCEEGLLPYARANDELTPAEVEAQVDEERRLFYVGMTRAQQKLVLTHARQRFFFGQQMQNRASRFVHDIEAALKEIREMVARKKKPEKKEKLQLGLFE